MAPQALICCAARSCPTSAKACCTWYLASGRYWPTKLSVLAAVNIDHELGDRDRGDASGGLISGVTSITSALASIHSCSVMGRSAITYLPSVCSRLPGVASVSRVAVLEPEDAGGDVGRHVLDVRHLGDVAVLVAEDLDGVVAVADGAAVDEWIGERCGE
jgi:hypothetical protein